MKLTTPELVLDARARLGEGPSWDDQSNLLRWVDILDGNLHTYDPSSGEDRALSLGQPLGCAAPVRDGGVIAGLRDGIALVDTTSGALQFLARPEQHLPGNRFNDGKCGPDGRFLVGSMDNAEVEATGSLYSLTRNEELKTLIGGVRISNGLAWSPDHSSLFYIDTPTRRVVAYEYDVTSGQIANPRSVVTVPESLGWPDGMTSDAKGRLWVAMWGGAAITVWDPANGALLETVRIPAKNVTACAFGGASLDDLYITSARKGLDARSLEEYPLTGGLFRIRGAAVGMPTWVFG